MAKNICPECNEVNEEEYTYCKNCGALLNNDKPFNDETFKNERNGNGFNGSAPYGYNPDFDTVNGIPTDDVAAFVGVKSYKIIPKFTRMQIQNSKTSWSWPVAILSFIFGPIGAAIWFFYRKMYKYAWLLVALGFLATVGVSLISGKGISADKVNKIIESGNLQQFFNDSEAMRFFIGTYISRGIDLLTGILTGLFSMYLYKEFATEKIKEYRTKNSDPRYYRIGLSIIGGKSDGMAVVGVVIMIFSSSIASVILNAVNLF